MRLRLGFSALWGLLFLAFPSFLLAQTSPTSVLSAPTGLKSETHPTSEQWFANDSPVFTWSPVIGARELGFYIGLEAASRFPEDLGKKLDRKQVRYQEKKVEDGVWYFHLFALNVAGWSDPAVYQFKVDSSPPKNLSLKLADGIQADDASVSLSFSCQDDQAGFSHYEVSLDGGQPTQTTEATYTLNDLRSGKHFVTLTAYDTVGNRASSQLTFTVAEPSAPEFDQEDFRRQSLVEGSAITFSGQGKAGGEITLRLDSGAVITAPISDSGFWQVKSPPLAVGSHQAVAWVKEGPNKSPLSEALSFEVSGSFWRKPGVLPALVTVIVLLGLMILGFWLIKKGILRKLFPKKPPPVEGDYVYIEPES